VKALIKVGYACNEHCTFCHTQDEREIQGGSAEVEAKIRRAKALGHSMVVLSGGEPTIRPELVRWATLVASLDMDFGLVTNGLVLAYPDVRDRLLAARLRYVYMSLHAGTADVHDRIVRAASFDTALASLRGLSGRGLALTVNCVVTRQNLAHLRGLVDCVAEIPDAILKFSATEPKGGALRLVDLVVPRIADAARAVADALDHADAKMPGRARHGGFPLCLLPGREDAYDDLRSHDYWTMVEIGEPDLVPVDDRNKLHPSPQCDGCALRGRCPGLFTAYHARFGAAELAPPPEAARSNAFDWALETVTDDVDESACPIRDGGTAPFERARHLFVRHAGKLARYRADTRDFADTDLEHIKHGTGQVYLDASRKPAPDDFGRDLVKLVRAPICAPCPQRDTCTGIHVPVFEAVFDRDEQALRDALAEVTGDVLEIGCGEGRLTAVWRAAIAAGRVRLTGVDPDGDALARLQIEGATLHHALAETLLPTLADASFDHVVLSHAWNHLRDPALVITNVRRVLRPGGELWISDDVPFGLARTPRQQRAARASTATWMHLRNDSAASAHRSIVQTSEHLLELVMRRDVAPDTSNQWLLRYRRGPA
jgi:MoaA/NifB/PqqE/SkfB family radical SAM enzyme/SAM-dependent methyltransferase